MAVTYTVEIPQLPALQRAFRQSPEIVAREVEGAINRSLVGYQATARQLAPISSGHLRGSIQLEPARRRGNTIEGSVGTVVRYAVFQERGTGIYGPAGRPIRPRRAKMLRFKVGGRVVFAREVRGSRPRWYFRGAVEQNQGRTEGYFADALEHVVTKMGRHLR
ncbi:MAG: hypothetical protein M3Q71_00085 [Chloroflexota bacterium]|nr:hypothetical protein [Chloroflexota bacterium]